MQPTALAVLLQPSFRRVRVGENGLLDTSDCVIVEFGHGDMPRVLNIAGFFNSIELRLHIVLSEFCEEEISDRMRQWLGHRFLTSAAAPLQYVHQI